jgi:hypothetical protein
MIFFELFFDHGDLDGPFVLPRKQSSQLFNQAD